MNEHQPGPEDAQEASPRKPEGRSAGGLSQAMRDALLERIMSRQHKQHGPQEFLSRSERAAVRKEALKASKKIARKEGRCTFEVTGSPADKAEGREKVICGAFATRRGLCRKHYNLKFFKVRPYQTGVGKKRRPFIGSQLPGNMSDLQHECLTKLPLGMSYEACLEAMNLADPDNHLEPIYPKKPPLGKSRT